MTEFVSVAKTGDISAGQGRVVEVNGKPIALFNVDGTYFAIDNICLHQGGPLGEGALDGKVVTCPWHAWTYDVSTGECTFNSSIRVDRFEVKVENGEVKVTI